MDCNGTPWIFSVTTAPSALKFPNGRGTPGSFLCANSPNTRSRFWNSLCAWSSSLWTTLARAIHLGSYSLAPIHKIHDHVIDEVVRFRSVSHHAYIAEFSASGIKPCRRLAEFGDDLIHHGLRHQGVRRQPGVTRCAFAHQD